MSSVDGGCKIKVHAATVDTSGPVLLSFLSGPPPEALLTGRGGSTGHAVSFEYSRRAKGPRRRLTGDSDVIRYEASNFGSAAAESAGAFK